MMQAETKTGTIRLLPLFALAFLAGCVSKADCDPTQVSNVLTAGACQISGTSQQRVDDMQAEVDAKIAAYQLTQAETRALLVEAESLAADQALWQARVAEIDRNLASLRGRIASQQARNDADRARLQALRNQLNQAQAQLDTAGVDETATRAEIETLTLEVERRRQAIEAYLNELDVVE